MKLGDLGGRVSSNLQSYMCTCHWFVASLPVSVQSMLLVFFDWYLIQKHRINFSRNQVHFREVFQSKEATMCFPHFFPLRTRGQKETLNDARSTITWFLFRDLLFWLLFSPIFWWCSLKLHAFVCFPFIFYSFIFWSTDSSIIWKKKCLSCECAIVSTFQEPGVEFVILNLRLNFQPFGSLLCSCPFFCVSFVTDLDSLY